MPGKENPRAPVGRSLRVLYRDTDYVAIDKPAGLLVHRSPLARAEHFALQQLRDQLGQRVYPVHRLDRATSGVLLFGLSTDAARLVAAQFAQHRVSKRYLAITRGWTEAAGLIDHPVADRDGDGLARPARTRYRRLATLELDVAVDRYPTSRYSLIEAEPLTGRRQQIRKHLKHLSHHLIGDTTHGNGRHNRFFRTSFGIHRLLLMAHRLRFALPRSAQMVDIRAPIEGEWLMLLARFGVSPSALARATRAAWPRDPSDPS